MGKDGVLERVFHMKERGSNVRTECIAGITTFLSCASVLILNPAILSGAGMDAKAVFWATSLAIFIACFLMGIWGNFPIALGPAIGLSSFMAFYVVKTLGMSWQNGLACVCISGCTFMLLGLLKVQQKIVDGIPDCIKQALGVGVGFFIAFIGFQEAGIVVSSPDTLLTLGNLGNPGTVIALIGIIVTAVLVIKNVKGGILIGIVVVAFLGLFAQNPVSGEAYTKLPTTVLSFDNPVEALAPTFGQLSLKGMFTSDFNKTVGVIFAILSFLMVDLFDSISVLLGVAPKADMVKEDGSIPDAGKALFVSASGAAIGAVLGTSTVSIYGAESVTGIAVGGRTGLTACVTGICFLLTLFFSPVFLMIPTIAIAPALIMVGIFMMEPLCHLDLSDFTVAMPVFFAVIMMPFTYNIANGVLFSILSYALCMIGSGRAKKLSKIVVLLSALFVFYLFLDVLL